MLIHFSEEDKNIRNFLNIHYYTENSTQKIVEIITYIHDKMCTKHSEFLNDVLVVM